MRHYHIAFVGMGSIGKRHLSNVCDLLTKQGKTFSIDLYRNSMIRELSEDVKALVDNQYLCSQEVQRTYDIVFITNPTSLHLETALKFRQFTKAFFIEKPVFSSFNVDEQLVAYLDGIPSYVACPLRYNPVIQYVKHNIDLDKVIAVRAISSSYLPDWRPSQDYRETYSAHSELGGGVEIDLIHEWDYITWIFGMPTQCLGIVGRFSNLDINSNDTAIYVARSNKYTYEVHLDYYGRESQRVLEIYTHDDTIKCNLIDGTISFLKEDKSLHFNADRNEFQMSEIQHFFDIVEGIVANDSNVRHGIEVLRLTKAKI